jgi:hypothetical protein
MVDIKESFCTVRKVILLWKLFCFCFNCLLMCMRKRRKEITLLLSIQTTLVKVIKLIYQSTVQAYYQQYAYYYWYHKDFITFSNISNSGPTLSMLSHGSTSMVYHANEKMQKISKTKILHIHVHAMYIVICFFNFTYLYILQVIKTLIQSFLKSVPLTSYNITMFPFLCELYKFRDVRC